MTRTCDYCGTQTSKDVEDCRKCGAPLAVESYASSYYDIMSAGVSGYGRSFRERYLAELDSGEAISPYDIGKSVTLEVDDAVVTKLSKQLKGLFGY